MEQLVTKPSNESLARETARSVLDSGGSPDAIVDMMVERGLIAEDVPKLTYGYELESDCITMSWRGEAPGLKYGAEWDERGDDVRVEVGENRVFLTPDEAEQFALGIIAVAKWARRVME